MNRPTPTSLVRLTCTVLTAWLLVACGGGVKSLGDLQAGSTLSIGAASGGDQAIGPRLPYPEEIVFVVSDTNGKPVASAAVEWKLIDVTGVEGINGDVVTKAWDDGVISIATDFTDADKAQLPEDLVGRIQESSSSTDDGGKVRAKVTAAGRYERHIAIIARIAAEKNAGGGIGWAILKTSTFGSSETLAFSTSHGLTEVAGQPFEIFLTVSTENRLAQNFAGTGTFAVTWEFPEDAGSSTYPKGDIECDFSGGRCRFPGGPFRLNTIGAVKVKVESKTFQLPTAEASVQVERGAPAGIVLSYKPAGEPLDLACPPGTPTEDLNQPCIKISADQDAVTLYPIIVDQGGNQIQGTDSTWLVTGPLEGKIASATVPIKQILGPVKTGKGFLTVTTSDGLQYKTSYEVYPGVPALYTVVSEHLNQEVATKPFMIDVVAFDRKGNACENYEAEVKLTAKLVGASNSASGQAPISITTQSVLLKAGKGRIGTLEGANVSGGLQAVLAGERPKIVVVSPAGEFQSEALKVAPGPLDTVQLRSAPLNAGTEFHTDFFLQITDSVTMYVAGYDQLMNYIGEINSGFSATGVLVNKLSGDSGTVFTVLPNKDGLGTIGEGTVVVQPPGSVPSVTTPKITVTSSTAVRLAIETEHSNTETAGVPFTIKIHAKDVQGVDSIGYEGSKPLQFVSTGSASWAGDFPSLPSGVIPCTFVAGVCTVPGTFMVSNITTPVILNVQDSSGEVPDLWSTFVNATLGTPSRLVIADKPGGPSNTALPVERLVNLVTGMVEMTADDTLPISAALTDAGGNYIMDAPAGVAWSGSGTPAGVMLPANFSAATGTNVVFNAALVGTGTITASLATYTSDTSPTINVKHGALHHVQVLDSANNNVETPGNCFQAELTLHDQDHNIVTSYNMTNALTLTWVNAASGIGVRQPPGFVVNGTGYNNTWSGNVGVIAGDVNTQNIQFCLFDATAVTPQLQVDFPAKSGFAAFSSTGHGSHTPSDTFQIGIGATDHVHFVQNLANDGLFACPYYSHNSGNLCAAYNVDNGPTVLYAHVHDLGCNYKGVAVGNWTNDNATIAVDMSNTLNSNHLNMANQRASTTAGYVQFTPTDGTPVAGAAYFRIDAGAPTHVTATINNGFPVKADTPWPVRVTIQDQFDNTTGYSTTHSLSFTYSGTATNSPKGTAPTVQSTVSNFTFPAGYYQSGSSFRTPRSNQTPNLTVSVTGFPDVVVPVTVNPGTAVKASIYDSPSISGAAIGNRTLQTINTLAMYGCAIDSEDNFAGCSIDGSWVGTNELAGQLIPSAGTTTLLQPTNVTTSVGYGVVTFTPNNVAIAPNSTGQIVVNNGPLARLQLDKITGNWDEAVAGQQFDLELRATDLYGNNIANFDGPYYMSWTSSNYTQNAEGYSVTLPADGFYNFTDGVATSPVQATFYNSAITPRIQVNYNDGSTNYYGNTYPFGGTTVLAGSPHHYGIIGPTNTDAKSDHSSQFAATLYMRDAYGNPVCCGEAGVSVSMMTTGGAATNGTLQGTLTTSLAGMTQRTISDFAYDIAGNRKLKAQSAGFTTPTAASRTITFNAVDQTVASYQIVPVATVTAGVGYPFTVRALDNAGNVVTGADSMLNALTFSWGGAANAPDSTAPSLPSTLTFIGGVASPSVTLFKTEVIAAGALTIQDNQLVANGSFNRSGVSTIGVTVLAGPLTQYHIAASTSSTTADSSGTFDLAFSAFDQWLNPRAGDGCLTLTPVRVSGVTNTGAFGGPASSCLNLGAGTLNVSALTYNVPHVIRFGLSGTSASVSQSDQISFTPTIHTVKSYSLSAPSSATVGNNNVAITVSALDGGGNVINNGTVDTALNAQSYCWSGAGTSPSPTSAAPVYDTSPSFSGGVNVMTHSLYKSEVLAINALTLQDNYSGSCSATRQGRNPASITLNPATADHYDLLTPDGVAQVAGIGFDATVRALDAYSNIDTNWASDTLTFSWTGTTATPAVPNNAGGITADTIGAASRTFTAGVYTTTSNPFHLYKETDASPVLRVQGASLPGPFTVGGWTVTHNPTVDFVKIMSASTTDVAHTTETTTHTMTTDQTKQLWAHGYDYWGNYIALQSVTWSGTSALAGDVPTGPSTTTTVNPHLVGSGVVNADHASATDDTTGTFTINPGAPVSYAVTWSTASPVTAGVGFDVTVTAKDADGNVATGYAGSKALTFVWNAATTSPAPASVAPVKLPNSSYTFTAGVYSSSGGQFKLHADADTAAYLAVSGDLTTGNSPTLAVDPAAANKYRITPSGGSYAKTAGTGFNMVVTAYDAFDNVDTNYASDTLAFSWSNTTASLVGAVTSTVFATGSRTFTSGVFTTTGAAFALYNHYDANPVVNVSGAFNASTSTPFTVAPAAVSFVKIQDVNTADTPSASELTTHTMTVDQTKQVWAHGYDAWGNWNSLQPVTWSASAQLAGRVTAGPANTTTVDPNLVGSGVVTADHASATDDSTGTFTINPGAATNFAVTWSTASPVTAGQTFDIVVTARDAENNTATAYTGSHNLTFAWTNASASPAPASVIPKKLANGSITFINGVYTSIGGQFGLYNDVDTAAYLTVGDGSLTPGNSPTLSVDPATANKYRITPSGGSYSKTAGTGFDMVVTAYDAYDNVDTAYGSATLTFGWSNTTASLVGGVTPTVFGSGSRTFTAGVYTTTGSAFTLYNHYDANPVVDVSGAFNASTSTPFTVAPAAVNFVKIQDVSTSDTPSASELTTHSMTTDQTKQVWAHGYDTWGNWNSLQSVTWSGSSALSGRVTAGPATSTTVDPNLVGSGVVTADHASVTDDTTGTFTINPGTATNYAVAWSVSTSVVAGVGFDVTVTARDSENNTATGFTGSQPLTFAWTGATNSPAPASTAPVKLANANYTFTAGVYTSTGGQFKLHQDADTAAYITVGGGGLTTGNSPTLAVTPAAANKYRITPAGGSYAKTAGTGFNVVVTAYDAFDNVDTNYTSDPNLGFAWSGTTASLTGAVAAAKLATGAQTFTAGVFTSTGAPFILYNKYDASPNLGVTGAFSASTASNFSVASGAINFVKIHDVNTSDSLASAEFTTHTMTTDQTKTLYAHGYDTWGNWNSLQSVTWSGSSALSGRVTAGPATSTTVDPNLVGSGDVTADHASVTDDTTGTFTINPGTATNYAVAWSVSTSVVAGVGFDVTVTARDSENNTATGFTGSQPLTFAWTGATNSPAPASTAPVKLANANYTFTAGVYTSTGGQFKLHQDADTAAYITVGGGGLTTGNSPTLAVTPAAANKYRITPSGGSYSKTAGTGFNMVVTAYDAFDNVDTNYTSDSNLGFAWSGTTASLTGAVAAAKLATGAQTFTAGVFTSTGAPFILYNTYDASPNLGVTGAFSASTASNFTVADGALNFVKIHDVNTADSLASAEFTTHTMTTDQTKTLYAHGYDTWGNWIALSSVTWSGSSALSGRVTAGPATSTTVDPNLVGSGVVTADHASVTDDTTGTFTINPGTATNYAVAWSVSTSVVAGVGFDVTVTARDSENNTATGFTGSQPLTFAWTGATNSPAPASTAPVKLANANYTFTAGVYTSTGGQFKLHQDADTAAYITVGGGGLTTGNSPTLAVTPAAANKYRITPAGGSYAKTAGTGFNMVVTAYDAFDNVDTNYTSDPNLGFAWSGTTASLTGAVAAAKLATGAQTFTAGVFTSTGAPFILYNTYDASPNLGVTGAFSASTASDFTVADGALNFVKIHDVNTADSLASADFTTHTMTTDQTKTLYAHGYDTWGNWIALSSVTWSGSSALSGRVTAGPATSTTVDPNLVGSGVVTADHASVTDDTTGTFTIDPGAAASYAVAWSNGTNVTAGTDFDVTITAKDAENNTATGYTGSHNLTFSWNSASTSPAPASVIPKKMSDGGTTFTAGVFTSIGGQFALYNDVDSAAYLTVAGDLTSGNSPTKNVNPASANKYRITPSGGSYSKTAGTGFNMVVTAYDAYDNVDTNYTSDTNLGFTWSGTTASLTGAVAAAKLATASQTFTSGVFTSTGAPFILYNTYDASPNLGVTGNFSASTASDFSVADGALNFVKIHDVNTADSLASAEFTTHTMSTDQTKTLYAHGYDTWGNWIGLSSVTWSGSAQLSGRVTAGPATSTTVDPNLIGSGVVTADHGSVTDDTTGTFTIDPGAATKYAVTWSNGTNVTAGVGFDITVTAQDAENNVASGYTGSHGLTFAWNSATSSPAPASVAPVKLADANYTFTAGVYTSTGGQFKLHNDADTAAYVAVGGDLTGANSPTKNVNPAAANKYRMAVVSGGLSRTAGAGFDVAVTAYDAYDNVDTNYGSDSLAFSWTSTTNSVVGNTPAAVLATASRTFTSGVYTSSGTPFILYNEADSAAQLNLVGAFSTDIPGFSVGHGSTAFVKVLDVSTADTPASSEYTTGSFTSGDTKQFWAHGYDAWGNYVGLASVDWTGTSNHAGDVSPTSGNTTTITFAHSGTGTVNADHATATDDASGTLTATPADFDVTGPGLTNADRPTMTWNASTGAVNYTFKVATTSNCASPVKTYATLTGTSYQLPGGDELADGTYYICATANGNSGTSKVASTDGSFSFQIETTDLHVAYTKLDTGTYSVNYGKKVNTGAWALAAVDSTSDGMAPVVSLALDSADKPHVSYVMNDGALDQLHYARNTTGSWQTETIYTTSGADVAGPFSSIALDSSNDAHYAHRFNADASSEELVRHASGSFGSWTSEDVASLDQTVTASFEVADVSTVVDSSNVTHVAYTYFDGSNYVLKYRNETNWVTTAQTVSAAGCTDVKYVSLAADGSGEAHVAFACVTGGGDCDVYYASSSSGTFGAGQLVGTAKSGSCTAGGLSRYLRPSLTLGATGCAHVAYVENEGANSLMYATNTNGSCNAAFAPAAVGTGMGFNPAIALDDDGIPYVFSLTNASGTADVKLSSRNSGAWATSNVDTSGKVTGLGEAAVSGVEGRSNH